VLGVGVADLDADADVGVSVTMIVDSGIADEVKSDPDGVGVGRPVIEVRTGEVVNWSSVDVDGLSKLIENETSIVDVIVIGFVLSIDVRDDGLGFAVEEMTLESKTSELDVLVITLVGDTTVTKVNVSSDATTDDELEFGTEAVVLESITVGPDVELFSEEVTVTELVELGTALELGLSVEVKNVEVST
jgi:hypothetical protein